MGHSHLSTVHNLACRQGQQTQISLHGKVQHPLPTVVQATLLILAPLEKLEIANSHNQNAHQSVACPTHQITAHFNVSKKSLEWVDPGDSQIDFHLDHAHLHVEAHSHQHLAHSLALTNGLEMDLDLAQLNAVVTTHQVIAQVDVLDHPLLVDHQEEDHNF